MLAVGLLMTAIFTIIKNLVDKKNPTLSLLAVFLFLLFDKIVLASALVQVRGFTTTIIGCLSVILLIKILLNDNCRKMNYFSLFVLGAILCNVELPYAFTIFAITVLHTITRVDKDEDHIVFLLLGETLAILDVTLRMKATYTGISYNVLHQIIPNICSTNFIITLLFSALVMIEAIKIFNSGKTKTSTLAIFGMASFLFSSLLSTNDYLNYITYIIYTISSIYILLNITNSRLFKNKVKLYYLTKFIFLFMFAIFGNVEIDSMLLLSFLDILLILEIYNRILPNDFIYPVWIGLYVFILGVNIYVYKNASMRYDEMNFFIKNKLECTREDITLPSKYETDFLKDYIPIGKKEIEEYIFYYDIDLYDKEKDIIIEFREK